jgi:hypothetical protein
MLAGGLPLDVARRCPAAIFHLRTGLLVVVIDCCLEAPLDVLEGGGTAIKAEKGFGRCGR